MNLARLTQIQAAALLSVAPRTMRDWVDAPRNDDGTYPGPALVAYYVAKLAATPGEWADQRERLAAAQAEKVEAENAVRRGQLADVQLMVRVWQDHIAAARAKLLGIAAKLSPQLVGLNDPNVISAAIRAEVSAALGELANYDPAVAAAGAESGAAAAGVDDVAGAPEPDSKPVGRPRKKAVERKQRRARRLED